VVLSGHQQSSVFISRLHAARLLLAHDHEDEYIHQRSSVVISSHQLACFWPTTMKMSTWKNGTASGIGSIGDALNPSTCSEPDDPDGMLPLLLLLLLLSVPRPVQLQQTVGGRDSALAVVTMPGTWSGT
jgi:hypothetical protein